MLRIPRHYLVPGHFTISVIWPDTGYYLVTYWILNYVKKNFFTLQIFLIQVIMIYLRNNKTIYLRKIYTFFNYKSKSPDMTEDISRSHTTKNAHDKLDL